MTDTAPRAGSELAEIVAAGPLATASIAGGPPLAAVTARPALALTVRRVLLATVALLALALAWEAYIALGNATDGRIAGWDLPANHDKSAMPHLWDIASRFGEQEVSGRSGTVGEAVLRACWYSLRVAMAGFAVGVVVGLGLAIVMERWRLAEQAILPYVIVSQTVPLVALAPLLSAWSGRLSIGGWEWQRWWSVAVISAYLAFFPVAVGALRGLQSPRPHDVELMRSLAASRTRTLLRLRMPASVPYLLPALRLAAAAAIVGAVVAEISLGTKGGIGRLIIDYFQRSSGDASAVYCAIVGAAALGAVVSVALGGVEHLAMRNRAQEVGR